VLKSSGMSKLHLKIVTPEKDIFDDEVSEVVATTDSGEIGILPEHISLMTQVLPGEVRVTQGNKEIIMAVGFGLLQVANNNVIITTDMAEKAEEIDEKSAEEARKRATAALEQKLSDEELATTTAALEKAIAQLKVKRRHRVR
jgi:F-type H+-transporting ATPase subunit epsilon